VPGPADTARPPTRRTQVPGPLIRVAGDYAWRLLAIGTVVYFGVQLLSKLALAVIPFITAILVTAVLSPLARRLRAAGVSRGLATFLSMLAAVIVFGGLLTVVILRAAQQAPQLGNELNNLLPQVKHWLIHGPLKLDPTRVNNLNDTITKAINRNSSAIASTALSTGKTVLSFLSGLLLAVFCTVFLVYDGDGVWRFLVKGVPVDARPAVEAAGQAAWATISYYIRGTLIVALFHGVVVSVTLTILGVPLAFPLGVLVALGSFVPLVGAILTGVLAVGVAGLSQGLVAGVVMTAVLLIDNQVEAHILQPFVVGRYVRIHPLATVLALAAGGILFSIVGAIIAVPVVATVNAAARAAMHVGRSRGGSDAGDVGSADPADADPANPPWGRAAINPAVDDAGSG
jgi:predicted PurR-regulated permease PerM